MNKVILIGRLTKDPEKKSTTNGISVTRFSIAVNRKWKNEDGTYPADFFSCVAWRATADFVAKYFTKGQRIGVCGSLQTRSYEYEGQKRTATEIVVDEVEFVESGASKKEEEKPEQEKAEDLFKDELKDFKPLDDADLPF